VVIFHFLGLIAGDTSVGVGREYCNRATSRSRWSHCIYEDEKRAVLDWSGMHRLGEAAVSLVKKFKAFASKRVKKE